MKLILAYEDARIVTGFRVTNFLPKLNTCVTAVERVENDLVLVLGSITQSTIFYRPRDPIRIEANFHCTEKQKSEEFKGSNK